MDYILVEADKFYKSLKCCDYLKCGSVAPTSKNICMYCKFRYITENLHNSIAIYRDSFLTDVFIVSNVNTSSGSILFLCSYGVALFRYVNGRCNITYFLFDSHCTNSRGITDGGPVFLVLLKFQSLFQIERYIEETFQVFGRLYPPYFQIQFISVNVNVDDLAIIQSSQIIYFRKMRRQQKQVKEDLQETRDRKHKKNPEWQKCRTNLKVLQDMKKSRELIRFVKKGENTKF